MINCYNFEDIFGNTPCPPVTLDEETCNEFGCGCTYLPFHKVIKHIEEIRSYCKERNKENSVEFIVKEKIKHLSRLFDKTTYQVFGFYSKAHITTKRQVKSNGTSFLEIGPVLEDTLQVCFNGKWIKPEFFVYERGFLRLNLTESDVLSVCNHNCSDHTEIGWLYGSYTVTGKFGFAYADSVIEMAILEQMLADFRLVDPKKAVENQLYPSKPSWSNSWKEAVNLYRADQVSSFC